MKSRLRRRPRTIGVLRDLPLAHERAENADGTVRGSELGSQLAARLVVIGFLVAVLAVVGWFVTGMPGMDHESSPKGGHAAMSAEALSPAEFSAESSQEGAFVVNVHTPYEGEIAGTDAFIAFDRIEDARALPRDTKARILIYCRSGRMSELAAEQLMADGYTNVAELRGGMNAWIAAGYELVARDR